MKASMRALAAMAALLWVAAPGRAAGPEAKSGDCTMKTLQEGLYCPQCDKLLEKGDVAKDGDCRKCDKKPVAVKVCLKKSFECLCGKVADKPTSCWGKQMAEKADKARVAFKCKTCEAVGITEKEVRHQKDCKKNDVKPWCTQSGNKPHDS